MTFPTWEFFSRYFFLWGQAWSGVNLGVGAVASSLISESGSRQARVSALRMGRPFRGTELLAVVSQLLLFYLFIYFLLFFIVTSCLYWICVSVESIGCLVCTHLSFSEGQLYAPLSLKDLCSCWSHGSFVGVDGYLYTRFLRECRYWPWQLLTWCAWRRVFWLADRAGIAWMQTGHISKKGKSLN